MKRLKQGLAVVATTLGILTIAAVPAYAHEATLVLNCANGSGHLSHFAPGAYDLSLAGTVEGVPYVRSHTIHVGSSGERDYAFGLDDLTSDQGFHPVHIVGQTHWTGPEEGSSPQETFTGTCGNESTTTSTSTTSTTTTVAPTTTTIAPTSTTGVQTTVANETTTTTVGGVAIGDETGEGGSLPRTGHDTGRATTIGFGLLAVGAFALLASRLKRQEQ